MSCCGQSGGQINLRQTDIDDGLRFEVEYWGGISIEVIGSVTGRSYKFSGLLRNCLIDPRDALILLRNPAFRLKGIKKIGASD